MEYTIIRTGRRTMALQVMPDLRVVVRAPLGTSDQAAQAFVDKHGPWLARTVARLEARRQRYPEPDPDRLAELTAQARAHIPGRVAHFSATMGLAPTAVKITTARTRFGSCSPKNSLCFSCRLMAYPPAAIDYVVVHELAHITHKNHGAAFYALVARTLPDWRERRALLRQ